MLKKIKKAFTMIELIFVIIIMGLLATFGVEFMVQSYQSYIFSKINNQLQNESAAAVKFISKRLSHRIKSSVIARDATGFVSIQDITPGAGGNYNTLEWIGIDIDGWRGNRLPLWSGIIDLGIDPINPNLRLVSPETNTSAMNNFISALSNAGSDINSSALYFIDPNNDSNISIDYGWDANVTNVAYLRDQNGSMHPIINNANASIFLPLIGFQNFNDVVVSEYYKHAWTAYAIVHEDNGDLVLRYDYQPWQGETFVGARSELIMQNVTTFQYMAIDTLIKIQVCVESDLPGEEYAICKEKTIY